MDREELRFGAPMPYFPGSGSSIFLVDCSSYTFVVQILQEAIHAIRALTAASIRVYLIGGRSDGPNEVGRYAHRTFPTVRSRPYPRLSQRPMVHFTALAESCQIDIILPIE